MKRLVALMALAGLFVLAACGGGKSAATPAPTASPTASGLPEGWNMYRDPTFGWSIRYPADWVRLPVNEPGAVLFGNPTVDPNKPLEPGAGTLLVWVLPKESLCSIPTPPQATTSAVTVDGKSATLTDTTNPDGTSVHVVPIAVSGRCYHIQLRFFQVSGDTEKAIVSGAVDSFRFGPPA